VVCSLCNTHRQGWLQPFFTFLGLGLLCFLPGFYVVRILVCILRGYQGAGPLGCVFLAHA
jgi:hypothetical protein